MELAALALFAAALTLCLLLDASVLYALAAGLVVFCSYAALRGFRPAAVGKMLLTGIKGAKNVLIVLGMIGLLTALWRACGTIPVLLCFAARLIGPRTITLMAFLLNCGASVLTGTAFGTAATMGVVCMTAGVSMGADPVLLGGAILSGVYFGDRCSPVSTSALLVSELTETDIFANLRHMLRTALVPFLLCCAVYGLAGLFSGGSGGRISLDALFAREFDLSPLAVVPAAVILLLSVLRVSVKITMAASILSAAVLAAAVQGFPLASLPALLLRGFRAADPELAALLDGGGLSSMLRVMAIVCLSSCYAGIFSATGLLDRIKAPLASLSRRAGSLPAVLLASGATALIACNQTLTIMLTQQLCRGLEPERERFALELEDSAVLLAPLVPWSIAGAAPLASIGAPEASLLAACFLYLVPIYRLVTAAGPFRRRRKTAVRPDENRPRSSKSPGSRTEART